MTHPPKETKGAKNRGQINLPQAILRVRQKEIIGAKKGVAWSLKILHYNPRDPPPSEKKTN